MITQLTNMFTKSSNKFEISSYNSIFHGFEEKLMKKLKRNIKGIYKNLDEANNGYYILKRRVSLKINQSRNLNIRHLKILVIMPRTLPVLIEHLKKTISKVYRVNYII